MMSGKFKEKQPKNQPNFKSNPHLPDDKAKNRPQISDDRNKYPKLPPQDRININEPINIQNKPIDEANNMFNLMKANNLQENKIDIFDKRFDDAN